MLLEHLIQQLDQFLLGNEAGHLASGFLPPLKSMTRGIELMLYSLARSKFSETSTLPTLARPANCPAMLSMIGDSLVQGPQPGPEIDQDRAVAVDDLPDPVVGRQFHDCTAMKLPPLSVSGSGPSTRLIALTSSASGRKPTMPLRGVLALALEDEDLRNGGDAERTATSWLSSVLSLPTLTLPANCSATHVDDRRQLPAGPAPRRPEIDDDRRVAVEDFGLPVVCR